MGKKKMASSVRSLGRWLQWVLIFAPALLSGGYTALEYNGFWDRLFGLDLAIAGLHRLQSAEGYPVNWISKDDPEFSALAERVTKWTREPSAQANQRAGYLPTTIMTAGEAQMIRGVSADWPQSARYFYTSGHPVLFGYNFGKRRDFIEPGATVTKACTLGELDTWLAKERDRRRLILGGIVLALISAALAALRHAVSTIDKSDRRHWTSKHPFGACFRRMSVRSSTARWTTTKRRAGT